MANGIVYIGCSDGKVYAFQAKTGKIVWTYTTNGVVDSSPTVVAGIVYVGSQDDSLYASNAATGALQWSYATGDLIESSPEVVNGVAYVSSDDGKIYAIRTIASPVNGNSAGSLLWSDSGAAFQVPAVAHGKVFYGYGTLYAVNSRSGAQIWSFTPDIYLPGHAIVANGIVYVTSASGILYGIDEATGAEVWHAPIRAACFWAARRFPTAPSTSMLTSPGRRPSRSRPAPTPSAPPHPPDPRCTRT